jgi:hypothetical protein
MIFATLILTPSVGGSISLKQNDQVIPQEKLRRANASADIFIKRFRETLDVGTVFDEMAIPDAIQRLQRARSFEALGAGDMASEMDTATAHRLYRAFMNLYYLRSIYIAGNKKPKADPDSVPLPRELRAAIQKSPYLRLLLTQGVGDPPDVTTKQELEAYIADQERVANLYRKYLPPNVFNTPLYKANVEALNKEKGKPFEIIHGYPNLEIKEDTDVFIVRRDIFTIYFIEDSGKFKILLLGLE